MICHFQKAIQEQTDKMAASKSESENSSSGTPGVDDKPVCVIVLGMAGSGKTTFVKVMNLYFVRCQDIMWASCGRKYKVVDCCENRLSVSKN